jgi:hypothetical protein
MLILTRLLNTIMSSRSLCSLPPKTLDVCLGGYGWKVMHFPDGINHTILAKIYHCLTAYLSRHSKVYLIRFDVSLYDSPNNNKVISKVISSMSKQLTKHYQSKVSYGWVREQNSTDNKCHYHCFMLLNGQKANRSKLTFDAAQKAKKLVIDLNIHFPKHCGYMVHNNDLKSLQAALYRLSYLSKNATKQDKPLLVKGYQFSRVTIKAAS